MNFQDSRKVDSKVVRDSWHLNRINYFLFVYRHIKYMQLRGSRKRFDTTNNEIVNKWFKWFLSIWSFLFLKLCGWLYRIQNISCGKICSINIYVSRNYCALHFTLQLHWNMFCNLLCNIISHACVFTIKYR